MASLRAGFEKELKSKLSQKSNQYQSEETVLLKAFKYFDLNLSGYVDSQQFLKSIEKLGLPVFNPNDFLELFSYYDSEGNGKLNYKDFVSQLFSNSSATTRQKSPPKNYSKTTSQYYRGHTSQDSVLKFQKKLHDLGSGAIFTLATSFSSQAQEGSRVINFDNFYNAVLEAKVNSSEEQLRDVFNYYDKQQKGLVMYDEFLQGLRGPISSFRKDLIRRAFIALDIHRQQAIPLQAIKSNYNARLHPDVRVGKRNEREVLSEFLRNLDHFTAYMNIQDEQITMEEFEEFFSLLSSSIENDTYFELLIKSTFRLDSSGLQFPIYQPQFSQQNQQQPSQRDISPDRQSNISNRSDISSQSKQNLSQIDSSVQPSNQQLLQQQDAISQGSQQSQRSRYSQRSQQSQRSQPKSEVAQSHQVYNQQDPKTQRVFQLLYQIRQKLAGRGARGFIGIQRQFRIMDDDYDMKISLNEFKKAMRDYKISLKDQEYLDVFDVLDQDNSGKLDIDEIVRGIRGPMNSRRQQIAVQAFNKLDLDGDGIITVNDIKGIYSARYHPDVRKGTRTEDEVLGEFLETFELHHNLKRGLRDQRVTLEEFIEYYNNVSANIDDDEYFELIVTNAFRLNNQNQGYEAFQASNQKAQKFSTDTDHRSNVTRNAPFGTFKGQTDYSTNSRPQSSFTQKRSNVQEEDLYKQNSSRAQGDLANVPAGVPSWPGFQWKPQQGQENQPQGAQQILSLLKQKLQARGTRGILSLGKLFKIADKNQSGYLDLQEFTDAINNLRLNLSQEQVFTLFAQFDRDQNGQINYDELLRAIRGNMNQFRRQLTMKAFQQFDKDGSGQIDINDLKGVYNASNHPDVRNGKKTEEEVLGEFLDTFELHHALAVGKNEGRNQIVTWEEFAEYYENISASIDDDKYFEVMLNSAWKLDSQRQQRPIF